LIFYLRPLTRRYEFFNFLKLDTIGSTLEVAKRCQSVFFNLIEVEALQTVISAIPFMEHDMLLEVRRFV
jgi:hypothetical protein